MWGGMIYLRSLIRLLSQVSPRLHLGFPGSLLEMEVKLQSCERSSRSCEGNSQFACPFSFRISIFNEF